jgi:hypothetical protein
MPHVRIIVQEGIDLPDGRHLAFGDVVHTEEYPGLETAIVAGVAEDLSTPSTDKTLKSTMVEKGAAPSDEPEDEEE